ncbi:MAG: hypothetical protein E2O84_01540 [Bacteroidetes bacterium]|nr:MAG: hypothetical protein E2O84_01540 [Bacteroidota bacterium]
MKIVDIELFPIRMKPVDVGSGTAEPLPGIPPVDSVILLVKTDSSVVGFGEATEIMSLPAHSTSGLLDRLRIYTSALIGADALNLNEINRRLDKASKELHPACQAARAALDMAIYDIIGKSREVPACIVLGGAYHNQMEVLMTLSEDLPEQNAVAAKSLTDRGIRGLRVNMGNGEILTDQNIEPERQKLMAVLESVGPEIQIDACANESWTDAGQVRSFFTSLLDDTFYGNLSVEQPLHHLDLKGHAELRESLPIPIILNESVLSPQTVMQIVHSAAADRIILNVHRVGGLSAARQIADICEAAAIDVSIGAVASTTLGAAAHVHLASTIRDPLPVDIGDRLPSGLDPFSGGFEIVDGHIILGDEPGLGVELEEDVLRGLAVVV